MGVVTRGCTGRPEHTASRHPLLRISCTLYKLLLVLDFRLIIAQHLAIVQQQQVMDNLLKGLKTRLDAKPERTATLASSLTSKVLQLAHFSHAHACPLRTIAVQHLASCSQVMDTLVGFKTRLDAQSKRTAMPSS